MEAHEVYVLIQSHKAPDFNLGLSYFTFFYYPIFFQMGLEVGIVNSDKS